MAASYSTLRYHRGKGRVNFFPQIIFLSYLELESPWCPSATSALEIVYRREAEGRDPMVASSSEPES